MARWLLQDSLKFTLDEVEHDHSEGQSDIYVKISAREKKNEQVVLVLDWHKKKCMTHDCMRLCWTEAPYTRFEMGLSR